MLRSIILIICWLLWVDNIHAEKPVLRILNWSDYIAVDEEKDSSVSLDERAFALAEFARQNNCRIEYYEYEETAEAFSRIRNSSGFYDVAIVSMGEVGRMSEGGYLETLDRSRLRNYRYVSTFYDTNQRDNHLWDYAMPYLYGTTGIAYRRDLLESKVTSWKQYFEPEEYLVGKIAMMNDSQVMFGLAAISEGLDPNALKNSNYRKLANKFLHLKNGGFLAEISSNVGSLSESLVNGDLSMAVMYSGDAVAAADLNPNIEYVVPVEGSEFYIDSMTILKDSSEKNLAYKFVNFMLKPNVNAMNSIELYYPTFNLAALNIVENKHPELLRNDDIYLTPEKIFTLKEFNIHTAAQRKYWNRFLNEN